MKIFSTLFVLALLATAFAAAQVTSLKNGASVSMGNGVITLPSGITLELLCTSPGWKHTISQYHKDALSFSSSETRDGNIVLKGTMKTWGGDFSYEQTVKPAADGSFDCSWQLKNEQGIDCQTIHAIFRLPASCAGKTVMIDNDEIILPALKAAHQNIKPVYGAGKIIIPTEQGKIEISAKSMDVLLMASAEQGKKSYYGVRINASAHKGIVTDSRVVFNVKIGEVHSEAINMNHAVNTAFADQKAEDRKGGWTDQGSGQDLAAMTPGEHRLGGILFNVIDPEKNDGKSCIVLKGTNRSYFPASAAVTLNGESYRRLYLLHAAAWADDKKEAGTVKVNYSDGTEDAFPVICGVDVADWAKSRLWKNAIPAWFGASLTFNQVTLYRSSFPLKGKPVQRIEFIAGAGPVWMIVAASGSNDSVHSFSRESETVTYQADAFWRPIDWKPLTTVKGSALDLSGTIPRPIGKSGALSLDKDNFYVADQPGIPLRFWGSSLTHELPFPDKDLAEKMADTLAAAGYNFIRFHCYHKGMTPDDGTAAINRENMAKFCYLLSCLRERGIYYIFPLFGNTAWANVVINDPEIPEFSNKKINHQFRALLPISTPAMDFMKEFSKNILCHVDPYTGKMIKDDPALIGIEMINENDTLSMFAEEKMRKQPPVLRDLYLRKCIEFLEKRNRVKPSSDEVEAFFPEFINLMQQKGTRELMTYLRSIGVTKAISECGSKRFSLSLSRELLDIVDCHAYWDLAEGLPSYPTFRNPVKGLFFTQLTAGATRLFGKPFAQGEYNSVYPSPYWAFIGPLEAVVAGIQNWSMVAAWSFNATPVLKQVATPIPVTALATHNPMLMVSQRIGSLLYKSGAVQASSLKIPYVVTREYIQKNLAANISTAYANVGVCCQIGMIIYDKEIDFGIYPCVVIPSDMEIPATMKHVKFVRDDVNLHANLRDAVPALKLCLTPDVYRATTGQAEWSPDRQTFQVATDSAECILLPAELSGFTGKHISVSGNTNISISFAAALDQKALKNSERLLAFYVTDLKNTGTVVEYRPEGGGIFKEVGTLPYLLKQGEITMTIRNTNPKLPEIWALRFDGARKEKITPVKTADGFSFQAKAVTAKDTYFAFEILY